MCSLLRQRISVPELKNEKGKYFLLVFSLISISFSTFILIFFQGTSQNATKHFFGLADNIFFLIQLISSFFFCLISYSFILKLQISMVPKESYYLNIKFYLLALMGITLIQYFFCLLLVSYYNPIIHLEKFLTSVLIILKEVNSILFLFSFMIYVVSMKYDFFYFYLDLNTIPDLEYFIDEEESFIFIK